MSNHIFLDAAYPPDPASLLTDMAQAGADGCFLYVWGPIVNWTPYHRVILQQAGLYAVPIIVPGNTPGDPVQMADAVNAWGWPSGPVIFDFEPGSDPGAPWFANAQNIFWTRGYHAEPYGTPSFLQAYDPEDKDWVATWIRTGTLDPLPALPDGWEAWQFVNDVNINGRQYDVSIVSDQLLGGPLMALTDQQQQDIYDRTKFAYDWITQNADPLLRDIQSATETGIGVKGSDIQAILDGVDKLLAQLPVTSAALTSAQSQQLQEVHDAVIRMETALHSA